MAKREMNLNKEKTQNENIEEPITQVEEKTVYGKVVNCTKLRVRKTPSLKGDVLGELDKDTRVIILDDKSSKFYKIEGGYCMKDFIEIIDTL